jgi:hypothetical protein
VDDSRPTIAARKKGWEDVKGVEISSTVIQG